MHLIMNEQNAPEGTDLVSLLFMGKKIIQYEQRVTWFNDVGNLESG